MDGKIENLLMQAGGKEEKLSTESGFSIYLSIYQISILCRYLILGRKEGHYYYLSPGFFF